MVIVDITKCAGCGVCEQSCPTGAIRVIGGKANVNPSLCNDCGVCVEACPVEALSLAAEPVAVRVVEPGASEAGEKASLPEVIRARLVPAPVPRSSGILPLVGAALTFVGKSLAPRLLSLLAERRASASAGLGTGGGRGRRRRLRRRGR